MAARRVCHVHLVNIRIFQVVCNVNYAHLVNSMDNKVRLVVRIVHWVVLRMCLAVWHVHHVLLALISNSQVTRAVMHVLQVLPIQLSVLLCVPHVHRAVTVQ